MAASPVPSSPGHTHPYAIKTTSTAILTRSNSVSQNTKIHSYAPPLSPPASTFVKHPPGHRHTRSLSSGSVSIKSPPPLPVPPSPTLSAGGTPDRGTAALARASPGGGNLSDGGERAMIQQWRMRRSETLPVNFGKARTSVSDTEGGDSFGSVLPNLPENPKVWSPSQLSQYLATSLRIKGGGSVPAPVARDIAAFVVSERITGRVFLRLTDEDLEEMSVNQLWRSALLASSRTLRKNLLKGRIWGFGSPTPFDDDFASSSLILAPEPRHGHGRRVPSTVHEHEDESAEEGALSVEENPKRHLKSAHRSSGKVRGMVESYERSTSALGFHGESGSESSAPRHSPRASYSGPFIRRSASGQSNSSGVAEDDAGYASGEMTDPDEAKVKFRDGSSSSFSSTFSEQNLRIDISGDPKSNVSPDSPASSVEDAFAHISSQGKPADEEEPSIESLLASEGADKLGVNGEDELTKGGTARPLRTSSSGYGSGKGSSKRVKSVHPKVSSLSSLFGGEKADAEVQTDTENDNPVAQDSNSHTEETDVLALVDTMELERLEKEAMTLQAKEREELIAVLVKRLVEVEKRLDEMETKEREQEQEAEAEASSAVDDPPVPSLPAGYSAPTPPIHSADVEQEEKEDVRPARHGREVSTGLIYEMDTDPSPADLPSYVLFVGLGVCAVVLRVMLKKLTLGRAGV